MGMVPVKENGHTTYLQASHVSMVRPDYHEGGNVCFVGMASGLMVRVEMNAADLVQLIDSDGPEPPNRQVRAGRT